MSANIGTDNLQPSIIPAHLMSRSLPGLVPGMAELVEELARRLAAEEVFDNPKLNRIAEAYLNGSRAAGTFTPRDVYDAMEAAVSLHLLTSGVARDGLTTNDPRAFLRDVIRPLHQRLPRQTDRTEEQIDFQQFSTPPTIAYVAARALAPQPEDTGMEPSAGTGALAVWLRAARCREVLTNEVAERRLAILELLGFTPTRYDGEILHDHMPREIVPTIFLTNPPFSATRGRVRRNRSVYGANHIASDLKRMHRGGRLVAVCTGFMALDRPGFSAWWRQIINRYTVRANLSLPSNEYARYGTNTETQLVVIDKTGATPGESLRDQLQSVVWGRAISLEDALDRIARISEDRPAIAAGATTADDDGPIIVMAEPREEEEEPPAGEDDDTEPAARPANRLDALEFLPTPATGAAATPEPDTTPAEDEGLAASERRKQDEKPGPPVYVPYVTRKLTRGCDHPAALVEAATMACVDPPDIHYRPHLQPEIITEGRLSRVQLERVIYAGQRHNQRLANGARAGFFNGDGTGAGKGRSNAGIILDNWNQGRRRALWLSVSQDLIEDARRDIADLGQHLPLAQINEYQGSGRITLKEGVIFCTYATLVSRAKNGQTRLQQLREWLDEDSVIITDECHKAKNAFATGRGQPTLTGQAVIDIQDPEVNPNYRVVYSSATGATDVRHLAYATRLGLWGEGTGFATFEEFMTQIEAGGVGAMELVCRDMKALGMYLSASLSYEGVEYKETRHFLTEKQREMYNAAAAAWQLVLQGFNQALDCTNAGKRERGRAMQGFWGRHQRFFKLLITAFKVPTLLREAERALAEDRSVIISLIGTGEARTKEQVAEALAQGGLIEDLDFSPLEIIVEAVNSCFPTVLYEEETDEESGKTRYVPVERDGEIVHSQDALELKEQTLDNLQVLELPENPLDQLVNYFGVSNVAEITGRKHRLIRNELTGELEYRKRAPTGIAMKHVNLYERQLFQDGKKRVAIISKASSNGISLHSDKRARNRQRREFMTLELSFSADEQMQLFGRGHRSNFEVEPVYNLFSSELAGEVRFSSTIARRLGSLGALTKGDRGAVDNELAKYNFETQYGRAALALLFRRITGAAVSDEGALEPANVPGLDNPKQTLRDMGLLTRNADGVESVREEDRDDVPRFFNRVLALDVDRQAAIANYFYTLFDEVVAHAKSTGTFDEGVQDIHAVRIQIAEPPRVVHTDRVTGATTTHFTLEIEVPVELVTFEAALDHFAGREYSFFENREQGTFIICTPSSRHTDPNGNTHRFFAITRPNGWRTDYISEDLLLDKYRVCQPDEARDWWQMTSAMLPDTESYRQHIISGAIIPLWERIQSKDGDPLKVVRVTTDSGERIVGIAVHSSRIAKVLQLLGVAHDYADTPDIFRGVLQDGARIPLVAELALKRSKIAGHDRIELVGASPFRFQELRNLGLIEEVIKHRRRFFVPTDEEKGCELLSKLFDRYPPLKAEEEGADSKPREAHSLDLVVNRVVFDLDELVNSPEAIAPPSAFETEETLFAVIERTIAAPSGQAGSNAEPPPDAPPVPSTQPAPAGSLFEQDDTLAAAADDLQTIEEQLRIEAEQASTTNITFVQTTSGRALTKASITVSEKKVGRRKKGVHEDQLGFDFLSAAPTEPEATTFFA